MEVLKLNLKQAKGNLISDVRFIALYGDVSVKKKAVEQSRRHNIELVDIMFILKNCVSIRQDYTGGCYTVEGENVDGERFCVVIAINNAGCYLKIINVWRL